MSPKYPTNLSDDQWNLVAPLIPPPATRPRKYSMRVMLNAMLYVAKTGCQWRMLPNDFPMHYRTVHHHFQRFSRDGIWEQILRALTQGARRDAGRQPNPSLILIDSQSVQHSQAGGAAGYDAGKKKGH